MRLRLLLHLTVIAILWALLSLWVGWFATPLTHPDGFQSIGASFDARVGHLSWPFVGNFEGFGDQWGYHWFGWPMIRSCLSGLFAFSALGDALFLHGARALSGILVAQYVYRHYNSTGASLLACAIILLQKGWFCSMAFLYRPETVSALLLWFAAEPLWTGKDWSRWRMIVAIVALFVLPMMHPLAVAAGCWVSLLGMAKGRFTYREPWLSLCLRWILPTLLGLCCLIWYYTSTEIRFVQLMTTVQTMQLIKMDNVSVIKNMFLAANNVFFLWPVTGLFIISIVAVWQKRLVGKELFDVFASSSFLAIAFVYLIAGGHPNVGHAALMTPFLGLWAAQVFVIPFDRVMLINFVRVFSVWMVLFCLFPLLVATAAYIQSPPHSPRAIASRLLQSALAQTNGKVVIPLSLWEAALAQKPEDRSRIRFSTFPNYASIERRQAYENEVIASMSTGDLLIMAPVSKTAAHPNDLMPYPRHVQFSVSTLWEKIAYCFPVYNVTIKFGSYERKDLVLDELEVFRYVKP